MHLASLLQDFGLLQLMPVVELHRQHLLGHHLVVDLHQEVQKLHLQLEAQPEVTSPLQQAAKMDSAPLVIATAKPPR